jgi:hypothetical protein
VSNFLLGKYDVAFGDFDKALLYLRQNQAINYEQLGLQFRLYSAEVLFNKGLCLIYLGECSLLFESRVGKNMFLIIIFLQ